MPEPGHLPQHAGAAYAELLAITQLLTQTADRAAALYRAGVLPFPQDHYLFLTLECLKSSHEFLEKARHIVP